MEMEMETETESETLDCIGAVERGGILWWGCHSGGGRPCSLKSPTLFPCEKSSYAGSEYSVILVVLSLAGFVLVITSGILL